MELATKEGEARSRSVVDLREAADQLFSSSTVVDLLLLLCREPERQYYVNELIRRTGRFPRSVQLALATLERAGLVRSERRANARFYQIDQQHPFYPELSSLAEKILDERAALRLAIGSIPGVRLAFLRPADAESSDLDLVVLGTADARSAVDAAIASVSHRLGRTIRTEHFTSDEWTRQARRERSFVRWLLEEDRRYVVGGDEELPRAPMA